MIQPTGSAAPSQVAEAERPFVRRCTHERSTWGQGRDMERAAPSQPRVVECMILIRVQETVTLAPSPGFPAP